jgi:hypothetical protein
MLESQKIYLECQPVFYFLSQRVVHCTIEMNQNFESQLGSNLSKLKMKQ